MTENVLAGLVSEEAADAYDRLLDAVRLPVGDGPGQFDLTGPPGRELADVITSAGHEDLVWAVHPSIALRRLLDRRHRELAAMQSDLAGAWQRFAALVSPTSGLVGTDLESADVRVVRDRTEMSRLATGMYRSPRRLLRGVFNPAPGARRENEGLVLPPADAIAVGVEFRMIYEAWYAADSFGSACIEQSVAAGEQARVRQNLPLRMMHVDDTVALVTIDHVGVNGALHIESPALLRLLAEWFDGLWAAQDTTPVGAIVPDGLTPVRRKVLTLLAAGLTDESIANHTGTAVRTVRRHVSAILEILQVDSRFAAGVAAVRRGWL